MKVFFIFEIIFEKFLIFDGWPIGHADFEISGHFKNIPLRYSVAAPTAIEIGNRVSLRPGLVVFLAQTR